MEALLCGLRDVFPPQLPKRNETKYPGPMLCGAGIRLPAGQRRLPVGAAD